MNQDEFNNLTKQNYNRIPVVKEMFADLDTPLSTYLKLANEPYTYLFESFHGGENWGRYSIIGLACHTILRITGNEISIEENGEITQTFLDDDPIHWLQKYKKQFKAANLSNLPTMNGGLVGYFAYDSVRFSETKLANCNLPDPINTPDVLLMISEQVVVFDKIHDRLFLINMVDPKQQSYQQSCQELEKLAHQLREKTINVVDANQNTLCEDDFVSNQSYDFYEENIEKIKEYILAGDVMQVVYSQRFQLPFEDQPINLYRALRSINPSPYLYYLNLKDFHIVGSSPEVLVRAEDEKVTVRPLAGTRHRGKDAAEDLALEKELLADPKECAEHLMLIDLGRNDIGRVCKTGSVSVTEQMKVEYYTYVMHIASNVEGELQEELDAFDALRAVLPAGTLSGAPKVRAMEIIDELEPEKRGIYGGAVGYIAWNGNMDVAIAIRTAIIKDKIVYVQSGAGVVADSIAQSEWEETMNKGKAIFKATAMLNKNFV